MIDRAYVQQKWALEAVHNQTRSENQKKFSWIINKLQQQKGYVRIAYI